MFTTNLQHESADSAVPEKSQESQAETFDAEFRQVTQNGNTGVAHLPDDWESIFAALDRAGVPDDFLVLRDRDLPQQRDEF